MLREEGGLNSPCGGGKAVTNSHEEAWRAESREVCWRDLRERWEWALVLELELELELELVLVLVLVLELVLELALAWAWASASASRWVLCGVGCRARHPWKRRGFGPPNHCHLKIGWRCWVCWSE
jgi:hypothetical protein